MLDSNALSEGEIEMNSENREEWFQKLTKTRASNVKTKDQVIEALETSFADIEKRVMAAEFSRELSAKVHAGRSRLVRLGSRWAAPWAMGCSGSLSTRNRGRTRYSNLENGNL